MITETITALGALKSASDMAKSLIELRDIARVHETAIELRAQIIAAQQVAIDAHGREVALQEKIAELETKIASFEDWDREKSGYLLTNYGGGASVYVLTDLERGESVHNICPNCYRERKKPILQPRGRTATGQEKENCPSCKNDFYLGAVGPLPARAATRPPTRWKR